MEGNNVIHEVIRELRVMWDRCMWENFPQGPGQSQMRPSGARKCLRVQNENLSDF